ncbi:MAG: NAD(P)-binding domain-containing protein, partial [Cyclobacteriaceae bacterium]
MTSRNLSDKPVGVIGAGNFGSAIANILSSQCKVLLYARDAGVVEHIVATRENRGHVFNENITPTNDMEYLAKTCDVLFPIVPAAHFRGMMKNLSAFLHPYHILIHGTKGFDLRIPDGQKLETMKVFNR